MSRARSPVHKWRTAPQPCCAGAPGQRRSEPRGGAFPSYRAWGYRPAECPARDTLGLRNTAIAHSEFERNPTEYNSATGHIWSKRFSILNEDHDLDSLTNLVTKFREQCHERASGVVRP